MTAEKMVSSADTEGEAICSRRAKNATIIRRTTFHVDSLTRELSLYLRARVGTGCSGQKIFGPPNQSGKIFGRSVEFGWSLVVANKHTFQENQSK